MKTLALVQYLYGIPADETCRELGISPAQYFAWKGEFLVNPRRAFGADDPATGDSVLERENPALRKPAVDLFLMWEQAITQDAG